MFIYNDLTLGCLHPPPNLTEAEWCIYASRKQTIIGSDNGLSRIRRLAFIWTNAVLMSCGPLGENFSETSIKTQQIFIHKNEFENVVCKMAATPSRPQYGDILLGLFLPIRRQAFTRTYDVKLIIGPARSKYNFSHKTDLKMSSAKWRPHSIGFSVIKTDIHPRRLNICISYPDAPRFDLLCKCRSAGFGMWSFSSPCV